MFNALIKMLFGCSHKRTSLPTRPLGKPGVPPSDMYVVCLDCGEHFAYDWKQMRMGKRIERLLPSTWE
jgi:hypothetical protein